MAIYLEARPSLHRTEGPARPLCYSETHLMSMILEWLIELWVTAWRADERLHREPKRWPWVVAGVAVVLLIVFWILEASGVIPW
jgi:hypothetical protein